MFLYIHESPYVQRIRQSKKLVLIFHSLYVQFVPGCTRKLLVNRQTECHNGPIVRHLETEHLFNNLDVGCVHQIQQTFSSKKLICFFGVIQSRKILLLLSRFFTKFTSAASNKSFARCLEERWDELLEVVGVLLVDMLAFNHC